MLLDSTNGLSVARPAILIDGQENSPLVGGLNYLLIIEKTTGLYHCEARFGNWGAKDDAIDFLYFDRKTLDFGKDLRVKIGDAEIFAGRITALEAIFPEGQAPEIVCLAEDALQNLRMTRRTRSFEDQTDADIFKKIAAEHGLTTNVGTSGAARKIIAQVNQSDLAFLRERARSINAEIWIKDKELNVKTRAERRGETVSLKYKAELREFRVLADLANQRTSVVAAGWDVSGKEAIKFEADESVIASELGADASGVGILKTRFGERKESLAHAVPHDGNEARAAAESYMKTLARQFVAGRGVAEPNPKLRVGASVELGGLGKLFDGKYYVAETAHIFDSIKGFRTEFRAERAGIGQS